MLSITDCIDVTSLTLFLNCCYSKPGVDGHWKEVEGDPRSH